MTFPIAAGALEAVFGMTVGKLRQLIVDDAVAHLAHGLREWVIPMHQLRPTVIKVGGAGGAPDP